MSSTPFTGLGTKVKAAYTKAVQSGAVRFTESEIEEADDEETGIPFEIRFAPALQKKPTAVKEEPADKSARPDPFAPPYVEDLYVTEDTLVEEGETVGEDFVVLLNKFCVTPRHFLLVTKEFKPQTSPLSPLELIAAWQIVKQLGAREKHLAFFNSGELSGASQPHKHIQFIPLSNGIAPFDNFINSNKPQNPKAPFQLPLPYANFTTLLAPPPGQDLSMYFASTFLALLDLMIDHLRRTSLSTPDAPAIRLSSLSYNVILTESYLHIVPRTAECYETDDGTKVSINALGFAGMVLVKDQKSLEKIKEVGVLKVLSGVAYRPVAPGESSEEVQDAQQDPVEEEQKVVEAAPVE
ncbi:HIT-like domain-containing protein [Leucosporidium creatinivorum]|uniref:HIT-like domain-containing protein n=1 Tax=Leucosporidium creatinivorum TaxID=106004 RepID=A0A1Y2F8G7_9BASI|nr:HIT-like domain-containing protein [Leucosporidium creatinivorum]